MSGVAAEQEGTDQVRPLVAERTSNRSLGVFAAFAIVASLLLFSALEGRRAAKNGNALSPNSNQSNAMIASPPTLEIPALNESSEFKGPQWIQPGHASAGPIVLRSISPAAPAPQAGVRHSSRLASVDQTYPPPAPLFGTQPAGPATVYQAPSAQAVAAPIEVRPTDGQRVQASRLINPTYTVPQGAVIQAVLETALDSTQPGLARAIVSRDVRGFDGSRVLIPRGSRLYGQYRADLNPGQNRAIIQWTRLLRPDGVTIALDSPSADPLGRAGVKGKVNSHFFARFGNALLQTVLNVGASAATRGLSGGTVIVGLPGSTQSVATPATDQIRPTLRVNHGTPVSVFVARDLDFSEVER